MSSNNPLYRLKSERRPPARLTKIAGGTPADANPSKWEAQVERVLIEQHPYVDLSQSKIDMDRDPETGRATGKIIIGDGTFIFFSIDKNPRTQRPEIDPIDVLFSDGRFSHLNEESWSKARSGSAIGRGISQQELGEMGSSGQGEYIGQMTGDVSPLEMVPYPGGGTGGTIKAASQLRRIRRLNPKKNVISDLVRDETGLELLSTSLATRPSLLFGAERLGVLSSIAMLNADAEAAPSNQRLGHAVTYIHPGPMGTVILRDASGGMLKRPMRELKHLFGQEILRIKEDLINQGWSMIRTIPIIETIDVSAPTSDTDTFVDRPGPATLIDKIGGAVSGAVCQVYTYHGVVDGMWRAILEDGRTCDGGPWMGRIMDPEVELTLGNNADVERGAVGVFIDTQNYKECTEILDLMQVSVGPDYQIRSAVAMGLDTAMDLHLRFSEVLTRPSYEMRRGVLTMHIPKHWRFVKVTGRAMLETDQLADVKTLRDSRKVATLHTDGMSWSITGQDCLGGEVRWHTSDEHELRVKLASLGAGDDVIAEAEACNYSAMPLYDVWPQGKFIKQAAARQVPPAAYRLLDLIKQAADDIAEGAEQMVSATTQDQEQDYGKDQKNLIEAVIISSFATPEHIETLIEAIPKLEDAEDTIARGLIAARCGTSMIDAQGARKALEGIAKTIKSLRQLQAIGVN